MKGTRNLTILVVLGLLLILGVWGCNGYNAVIKQDETVKKTWNNVNTEYQKRSDLVGNLVNTVKGAANFEQETLTKLVEARAKATSINLWPGFYWLFVDLFRIKNGERPHDLQDRRTPRGS